MKAIRLEEPGRFEPVAIDEPPPPRAGEALVRVHRVGICGTDISGYLGKMPFYGYPRIPGHELGVEVLAVGEGVTGVLPGDRCAVEPYIDCQECFACRRGASNCCRRLEVLGVHADGGLRPRFIVPARKLHRSERLTLEQLVLVETLSIGCHAVDRAGLRPGEQALVIGAGPIGLSVIEFAMRLSQNPIRRPEAERKAARQGAPTQADHPAPLGRVGARRRVSSRARSEQWRSSECDAVWRSCSRPKPGGVLG